MPLMDIGVGLAEGRRFCLFVLVSELLGGGGYKSKSLPDPTPKTNERMTRWKIPTK